jgi:hypothetical protein
MLSGMREKKRLPEGIGFKRGRRRTRQDQISAGLQGCESIGSLQALNPPKLRTLGTRTERRKVHFFCRTGFRKDRSVRNLRSGR